MKGCPRIGRLATVAMLLLGACGGDGSDGGSPRLLLTANGFVTAAGRTVVPTHGASNVLEDGTVNVMFSDVPMGCATLTQSALPNGTYMQVDVPSAEQGVAEKHLIVFKLVSGDSVGGCGSRAGQVEVLGSSDTAVTIRAAYQEALEDGVYALGGDFGVVRCR
jgi:hypothetical protein